MKVSLWKSFGAQNSKDVFQAMENGIRQCGDNVVYDNVDADIHVIWSVLWNGKMKDNHKIWKHCKKNNIPIIVLEVGGLFRNITWKVGVNGINRNAKWPSIYDENRPSLLGLKQKPWNVDGKNILICGQNEKSEQWNGMPATHIWMQNTIEKIRKYSDKKIILRPHPRFPILDISKKYNNVVFQAPQKIKNTYDDYDFCLKDVGAVISHNSNPGIQTVINGIPVWTDTSSLAYPVSNKCFSKIENPVLVDRDDWLLYISHTEYTLNELSSGMVYQRLTGII